MENKICVYAICKDEIKFVDKWLDSMAEADYIVVLDTGSTDGTYEKLKSDPRVTKVKKKTIKPWRFDVARNESMKLIPKDADICVCTDLDEIFEPGWAETTKSSWTEDTWRGRYRYIWSHSSIGNTGVSFGYDKMHSNHVGYKWYFPVHEVLGLVSADIYDSENIEKNGNHIMDYQDNIVLHHYPDNDKDRSNYLPLLQIRAEEDNGAFSWYLLGREYAAHKEYQTGIDYFEKSLACPDIVYFPQVKYIILGYMGDCYELLNDRGSAIMCYNLQLLEDNTYLEPYIRLAGLYARMELYEMAIGCVEQGKLNAYRHYDWTEQGEVWDSLPDDILSVSYLKLGKKEKALEHVVKALKLSPDDERIRENYLSILSLN